MSLFLFKFQVTRYVLVHGIVVMMCCVYHTSQQVKSQIQELVQNIPTTVNTPWSVLLYWCAYIKLHIPQLTLPIPSYFIAKCAEWIGLSFKDKDLFICHFNIQLTLQILLKICNNLFVNKEQTCELIRGLAPHCHLLNKILAEGNKEEIEDLTNLLTRLCKHDCDDCDTDCFRHVLVKSKRISILDVVQLNKRCREKGQSQELKWLATYIPNLTKCAYIGDKLGYTSSRMVELLFMAMMEDKLRDQTDDGKDRTIPEVVEFVDDIRASTCTNGQESMC